MYRYYYPQQDLLIPNTFFITLSPLCFFNLYNIPFFSTLCKTVQLQDVEIISMNFSVCLYLKNSFSRKSYQTY